MRRVWMGRTWCVAVLSGAVFCTVKGSSQTVSAGVAGDKAELGRRVAELLADPTVARAHWGVMVEGMDGRVLYGLNEGQLFQPASNAKLFTTAAALALLGGEMRFETQVFAEGTVDGAGVLAGDLVLFGRGEPNLSGRELPYVPPAERAKPVKSTPPVPGPDPLRYLGELADKVAASGSEAGDRGCRGRRHVVSLGAVCSRLGNRR